MRKTLMVIALVCTSLACGARTELASPQQDAGSPDSAVDACDFPITPYDLACSVDTDCVTVFIGDVCGHCLCPNASIAAASQAQYEQDLVARHATSMCFCSVGPTAVCCNGSCTISAQCQ